jgi:CHAD domain-containing protein
VVDGSPPDGPSAGQLADQRLHRTFRKVAARAKAISPASESEAIHDLRKACKELRYLLEMFKPLCDPRAHRAVIADFKGLQDVLGEFQDGEVQAAALREFAEEMLTGPGPSAATLLAMGELAARFDERQAAARSKLLDQHLTHLSRSVARHVDHVVAIGRAR